MHEKICFSFQQTLVRLLALSCKFSRSEYVKHTDIYITTWRTTKKLEDANIYRRTYKALLVRQNKEEDYIQET